MIIKKALSVIISSVLVFSALATPAFAQSVSSKETESFKVAEQRQEKQMSYIRQLEPFVSRESDGTFTLKAESSVTKKIDSSSLNAIISGMEEVNGLIKEGKLKSTSSLMVYDPTVQSYSIQGNLNATVWHWWGVEIYLDNTNTTRLEAIIAGGAGTATIAAAIAGMIPGGQLASGLLWVVDGIIGIWGAEILYAAAPGNGIKITANYVG